MIGNALEQEIIELYSDNPSSLYSINQIASKLGKKYPYINKKVTILVKNHIFKKTVVGRSHLRSLNLQNDETVYLLILNEIRKKKKELESNQKLSRTQELLLKITRLGLASIILKLRNSIVFVVNKETDKDKFKSIILAPALSGYEQTILSPEEFNTLLKEDRSIHDDHIILYGFEKYYEHIREIEDELKLRYAKLIP